MLQRKIIEILKKLTQEVMEIEGQTDIINYLVL